MGSILEKVNSPEDLKKLQLDELEILASDIRKKMVETVSLTGGHLAPSLGVVELTIALHYVFDSPIDKLIWDVGHQCYAHKIITGRKDSFHTLRQLGGVAGFPKRSESPHDIFNTGHSSTSISAALGLAEARDKKKEDYEVVAIIGDGALTGGMAFEALNHTGHLKTNLIVILNDNEMSIDGNVGAVSEYLNKIRTGNIYSKIKQEFTQFTVQFPKLGKILGKVASKLKGTFKYFLLSDVFFEELGFTYLGPVNGHDIKSLIRNLERCKKRNHPVILHVRTEKGHGYKPALDSPERFHGIGPFHIKDGKIREEQGKTFTDSFKEAILEEAGKDERLVAITAAMKKGTGLEAFSEKYPDRFYDVGIAEQHAVTLAAGMAAGGLKPVVAIYSTFMQRAVDQVIHDVCLQNLPVVFCLDRAGLVGRDGETHHGVFDISLFRSIPNLEILSPADGEELKAMLSYALDLNSPVIIRYPREKTIKDLYTKGPIEKGKPLKVKDGNKVAILATGYPLWTALEVAKELDTQNISTAVFNARFIKPLDVDSVLEIVNSYEYIYTIEEHVLSGGFGSAIMEIACGIKKIGRFGIKDVYVEHGSQSELKELLHLNKASVLNEIIRELGK